MFDWLLTPISGSPEHHLSALISWHGRLMVLAWGILVPLGVMAARYFKITPWQDWPRVLDNTFWWHVHRRFHYLAMGLAAVAVVFAMQSNDHAGPLRLAHGLGGWTIIVLGAVQLVSAWLRGTKGGPTGVTLRGDHYDMTPRRHAFEYVHKFGGLLAVFASQITLLAGLLLADAPRWMALVMGLWWLTLAAAAIYLQRQGRCIDTYQAIWGNDPKHPGAALKPIGLGVRKLPRN